MKWFMRGLTVLYFEGEGHRESEKNFHGKQTKIMNFFERNLKKNGGKKTNLWFE